MKSAKNGLEPWQEGLLHGLMAYAQLWLFGLQLVFGPLAEALPAVQEPNDNV